MTTNPYLEPMRFVGTPKVDKSRNFTQHTSSAKRPSPMRTRESKGDLSKRDGSKRGGSKSGSRSKRDDSQLKMRLRESA